MNVQVEQTENIDPYTEIADQPLRVMHLILNLDIGGAQEVVRTLVNQMAELGHKPLVCSFRDGPLRLEIEKAGIPVEIIPERQYTFLYLPQFVKELIEIRNSLLQLVKKYGIQVIQTHLLQSLDFLVSTISIDPHPPKIFWTIHNVNFMLQKDDLPRYHWMLGFKRTVYRFLFLRAMKNIDGLIAVSEQVSDSLFSYSKNLEGKITVINNGVDINRYRITEDKSGIRESLGYGEDDLLVITVAILKEQKGHRYLISAAAELIPEYPKLKFLLAGDGILKDDLIRLVDSNGIGENFHFLGIREDIPELLAACDYFILPSLWEGLPMALIEAMASGLPIVATEVSGSKQVMNDGKTGLLVPPGDSHALAQALTKLISQPNFACEMANSARERIQESYSVEKQTDEHIDLYMAKLFPSSKRLQEAI